MRNEILIVEDDKMAPLALMRMLDLRGYRVDLAPDAILAMTHVVRKRPSLIVLDMGLPAGGGYAVLKHLRALPSTCAIPVVVLTGDRVIRESDAITAGANAFHIKGDGLKPVLASVENWLPISPEFSRLPAELTHQGPASPSQQDLLFLPH